ncbi:MAG: IS1595 family transposase [Boseongicola sp. SB0662_bin_57]|nr:IS1595 family transposase [Boseongicola sp. SB0662_bin_57]
MPQPAPGRSHREGMTLVEMMDMFPTDEIATKWFEDCIWPDGKRTCGKCGSERTSVVKSGKPMPYHCKDCRSYFSVKTNTPMQASNIPMRKWAIGIYLCITSLKSVSSMKLHRDLGISQKAAWFMMMRIREAWACDEDSGPFDGPVEFDETYMGGKRKNKSNAERKKLKGRGPVDMTAVVGAKCRATNKVEARVVRSTDKITLQGFVDEMTNPDTVVYTDDAAAYQGIPNPHETVNHSVSQYVDGMAHTNGMESFWSMLKRAHKGTFHKMSPKHLQRYVNEFEGKHNIRNSDTLCQMRDTVARFVGRNLLHRDLVACNGLSSGARS